SRIALMDAGDGNYLELFDGGKKVSASEQSGAGHAIHFAFRVPDADAAYHKALAAGAQSHSEPKDVEIQGRTIQGAHLIPVRIVFSKGPDGEIIEFYYD